MPTVRSKTSVPDLAHRCIKIAKRTNERCKFRRARGHKICNFHLREEMGLGPVARGKAGAATRASFEIKAATREAAIRRRKRASRPPEERGLGQPIDPDKPFHPRNPDDRVISEQARNALAKLGQPLSDASKLDPKLVLLDTVRSASHQREVLEIMLANTPPEDWGELGMTPMPGTLLGAKGARIEALQKQLQAATNNAARVAKMAIDAGIEERLVKLAEDQSALIADTVRAAVIAAIGSMHLSAEAESAAVTSALGAAATHLRALAAGPVAQREQQSEIIDGIAVHVDTPVPEMVPTKGAR